MNHYIICCVHVGCFFHARRVCTILCAVFAWVVGYIFANLASEVSHIFTQSPIDGRSFHIFLANAKMITYFNRVTPSSALVSVSVLPSFFNSLMMSVRYCSCCSLGRRTRNGSSAFMKSNIKRHKHISKGTTCHIACLMRVPGNSNLARGVTQ